MFGALQPALLFSDEEGVIRLELRVQAKLRVESARVLTWRAETNVRHTELTLPFDPLPIRDRTAPHQQPPSADEREHRDELRGRQQAHLTSFTIGAQRLDEKPQHRVAHREHHQ